MTIPEQLDLVLRKLDKNERHQRVIELLLMAVLAKEEIIMIEWENLKAEMAPQRDAFAAGLKLIDTLAAALAASPSRAEVATIAAQLKEEREALVASLLKNTPAEPAIPPVSPP